MTTLRTLTSLFMMIWKLCTRRTRQGKCCLSNRGGKKKLVTNFGQITIHPDRSGLHILGGGKSTTVPFDSVLHLVIQEWTEVLSGTDLLVEDLLEDHDHTNTQPLNWRKVSLVLNNGRYLPLYTIGKYQFNHDSGFFGQLQARLEKALNAMMGFRTVEQLTTRAVTRIRKLLAEAGQQFPVQVMKET